MSELRQNLATKEWVIIATERAKRPVEFAESSRKASCADAPSWDERCPFCPGNEEVDLEVMRVPSSGEPWRVRIVERACTDAHNDQVATRSPPSRRRRG